MIEKDYSEEFEYLNELRESGETNMFGAARYLRNDFGLSKYEARDIVLAWMKSFNKENV
jgi:hypothetical protein